MAADRFQRWNDWAPRFIADLVHDFGLTPEQAAGFVGNFAAESSYFNDIVEDGAIAKGWAGGTGFAQWTGSRRRLFEAWLKRKGFRADSYEGNYSYLFRELRGLEPRSVTGLTPNLLDIIKAADTPRDAAYRVARYFEKPKVINLEPRAKAAAEALALYRANPVKPTEWLTDKESSMSEEKKVIVSNEPPALPWLKSPVFTGSLAGLAASIYAIIQVYKPGVPISQQLDVLWPPTVAAIGTALAAYKRWASTAQPLTATQASADEHKATVSMTPTPDESREVVTIPQVLPMEQMTIQQVAHELPKFAQLAGMIFPQLAILGKIGDSAISMMEQTHRLPPPPKA